MNENVLLGTDVQSGLAVGLGLRERQQGTYIIGRPGTGKTTLIEHMVVQDMEAGLGLCVLDPHGDLVDAILARVPPAREHDVILLDAADTDFPFGLNMFECRDLTDRSLVGRVAAQSVEVFEKLWGDKSWGPQLAQVLRNCAYTMVENPGYTLAEMQLLLADEEFRSRLTANLTLPQARQFWELEYNPLPRREQQQRVSSTLNKVDEFLTPAIYPIVGFGRTTVDFREAMDDGKILLVKLPVGQLGAGPVGLLGSMIVAQIFNAALSRQELEPAARRQFNLFADEYHRFATPTFAELLAEARKYGVATTLAHQFRDQLDDANRGATLTAGNLIVFAVSGEDAEELAKQFDRTPPPPDIVGQRPKLSISQRPVEHLVRHGHESEFVREAVANWLEKIVFWSETLAADRIIAIPIPGRDFEQRGGTENYKTDRAGFVRGVHALNEYLVGVMEHSIELRSPEEAAAIGRIFKALSAYFKFAPQYHSQYDTNEPLPSLTYDALHDLLRVWLSLWPQHWRSGDRQPFIGPPTGPRAVLIAARLDYWSGREHHAESNEHRAAMETMAVNIPLRNLHNLGTVLAEQPILVDSGQWEPIYDRPRSYSDVEGEIASNLVNLPKYHGRTRLLHANAVGEHFLRTPEYRAYDEDTGRDDVVSRIRDRTRMQYCSPLSDVLDAITRRSRIDPLGDVSPTQRRVRL